jgi:septum formation protein
MSKIVLGSASPRRQQLLSQAEIQFTIITADIDERFPPDMPVADVPLFIAKNKAAAIMNKVAADDIVITADTVVVLHNEIIGKPNSEQAACDTLAKLSGQIHHVITGVCIFKNGKEICITDTTEVEFNIITDEQIKHYVQHYKPYDKAGAYAIQEWIGVIGIKAIRGCFYNVMGLPVSKVLAHL